MSNDQKINYIELPASDLDAVEAFYSGAFGWTFVDYGSDYKAFNDGQLDGGFYRSELASSSSSGSALVVLYADNLEKVRETVTKLGATIVQDIFNFPGGRRFHFGDPNGNELAVWSER